MKLPSQRERDRALTDHVETNTFQDEKGQPYVSQHEAPPKAEGDAPGGSNPTPPTSEPGQNQHLESTFGQLRRGTEGGK